jgi:hypothetical protein
MADTDIPKFKNYAEGEAIPPVDPKDIKRFWKLKPPWGPGNDVQSACSPGADTAVVYRRWDMIQTLTIYNLLTPWHHGEDLDDAVFQIAATFPLRELKHKPYMITGDERFGFDPNAFVQRLVEGTGIAHVWEPVATKIAEGGRCYSFTSVDFTGQAPNPEREAKRQARELVWHIWKRFSPSLDQVLSHRDKEHASEVVATFFADFLIDNFDLVRQVEDSFRAGHGGAGHGASPLDPLDELERRAAHPW